MNTLLLDRTVWDLCLDASRNIAVAADPYSVAQDVASAVKLFLGELYYDTTKGVPYRGQILGAQPPIAFIKAQLVAAAETVPGVSKVACYITSVTDRTISGQMQVTDTNGETQTVSF